MDLDNSKTLNNKCDCSNKSKNKSSTNKTTPTTTSTHPLIPATQRTISVQSKGEVECRPDKFTLTLTITSTKQKLDEAQSSVKRRTSYILQVLRNHGYNNDKHVHVYEEVTRVEGGEEHNVKCIVMVEGGEMERILGVKNILMEKMDSTVTYSNIECHHTSAHKAKKREESFKAAVTQAKSKAHSVSQSLGVQLGSILYLNEEKLIEKEEKQHNGLDSIELTIITYVSYINTVFDVLLIKRKR